MGASGHGPEPSIHKATPHSHHNRRHQDYNDDDDDDDDDYDDIFGDSTRGGVSEEDDYDIEELEDIEEYNGQVSWSQTGRQEKQTVDTGGGRAKYIWMRGGEASDGPPCCHGDTGENCSGKGKFVIVCK